MPQSHYDHEPARRQIGEGIVAGAFRWLSMTLGQAVNQAPIEYGALRGSGTIEEPDAALVALAIAAGGLVEWRIVFPLIYAAYQHEGMRADGSHVIQNHPKGGKTHYLSDPVKQNLPTYERALAAGARERMR